MKKFYIFIAAIKAIFYMPLDLWEGFISGYKLSRNIDTGFPLVDTCHGYSVFLSDEFCIYTIHIPSRIPAATAVALVDGSLSIVINKKMNRMPDWFKQAAIAHEVGHLELHGAQLIDSVIANTVTQLCDKKFEYEADAYAKDHGYNIQGALEQLERYGFSVADRIEKLK